MRVLTGLLAILALGACEPPEKEPAPEVPVRAIKYMTIGSVADEDERILAGVVEAGTSSNVAFEIGGRVLEMTARVGETIETGQYLARLDPEPYELQVQQAEYTLRQAIASEEDARAKYAQQSRLWQNRYTTKTALDTALSNLRNAEGQIGIARSQLDLRKRDLQKTRLLAPFGGRVAEREVEVFEEVTAGQAIYALQTEGDDEVSVSVPEKLVPKMRVGQRVSVSFPPLDGAQATGIMTEISPRAGDGNAYPAKLRLDTVPPGLRAGMSAEITVSFATEQTGSAFTVPIGALKGSPSGASQAVIYVYDAEAGVVRERAVKVVGMEGNTPQIVGNLQPGEIIATAGVGYMFDGMEVRLLDPSNPF